MFVDTLDFVSKAARGAVECSIDDLRSLPELRDKGALEALREIVGICERAALECHPSLSTGELNDIRVFTGKRSADLLAQDARRVMGEGEGHKVEFKQTFGLHLKRLENDKHATADQLFAPEIIHEVIKTVVSFLNADGGTLLIGVRDDGKPFGIENEFAYVPGAKSLDGWCLRLNNALESLIPDYRHVVGYISQAVVEIDGCKICVINIEPRKDRISVCLRSNKPGEDEIVYRRSGSSTLKLQAREIEALVLDRLRTKVD